MRQTISLETQFAATLCYLSDPRSNGITTSSFDTGKTTVLLLLRMLLMSTCWTLITQPEITCSKLTIETLEQGVKYVQS